MHISSSEYLTPRDLFKSIMGQEYNHTIVFHDIVEQLIKLDSLLYTLNEDFISLQRVGVFHFGQHISTMSWQKCTVQSLSSKTTERSPILNTYSNIQGNIRQKPKVKIKPYQTPFLTRHPKCSAAIDLSLGHLQPNLRLICDGDLQSIESLNYCESEKLVRFIIKKYKSIQTYHEQQQIKRQYKFLKPEIFLRGVLKYVTKFQPCEIEFQPVQIEPNLKKKSSQKS